MSRVNGDTPEQLYLLHIEPSYRHARHYLGWTNRPEVRIEAHLSGNGSPLVRAEAAALRRLRARRRDERELVVW